jgi:hypothetical protein
MTSASCEHRLEKTNDRILILYLKCPMYLKLKSQFSRLWHKLKDKRAALLSSATHSIRHLDFYNKPLT